jgi:uncharacterized OsmC-like protein
MYRVEIASNGGSLFNVKSKDYNFAIDTEGNGISPPAALLASLGSCIGVYIRKYCDGAGLVLGYFKISVEADFSKELPLSFKTINVLIDLEDAKLDERRKHALLEFIKNCPVHNTLKASPDVQLVIA